MLLPFISLARPLCATAVLVSALRWMVSTASGGSLAGAVAPRDCAAQANLLRLECAALLHDGGFRLRAVGSRADRFAGRGQALAFNPQRASQLFLSFAGRVADVNLPTP